MGTCTSTNAASGAVVSRNDKKLNRQQSNRTTSTAPSSLSGNNNSTRGLAATSSAQQLQSSKYNQLHSMNGSTHPKPERASLLYDGLVRTHDDTTCVQDYYDIIECIGRGSFSNVYKIKKKISHIGGTSRSAAAATTTNVQNHQQHAQQPGQLGINNSVNSTIQEESEEVPMNGVQSKAASSSTTSTPPVTITNVIRKQNSRTKQISTSLFTIKSNRNAPELFYVLKEMDLSLMINQQQIELLINEVNILKTLDHQHIIKIYETFASVSKSKLNDEKIRNNIDTINRSHHKDDPPVVLQVVMEYCSGGDLYTRLPYTEHTVALMTRQIVSAISYLHERDIIHRDLKLENIVFENTTPNSIVKLIDFGVSYVYTPVSSSSEHGLSERVGTIYSMAPETMKGNYTSQADLWSLGICVYMLLANGSKPFDAATSKEIVHKVLKGEYTMTEPSNIWSNISDLGKDFIRSLLVVNPNERLTAHAAKTHPWIQQHYQQEIMSNSSIQINTDIIKRVHDSIKHFANTNDFVKLVLNVIAKKGNHTTTQNDILVRILFDQLDNDQSGTLSLTEFKPLFLNSHSLLNDTTQQEQLQNQEYTEEYVEDLFEQLV
jgi:calcium-dependent protein kinase